MAPVLAAAVGIGIGILPGDIGLGEGLVELGRERIDLTLDRSPGTAVRRGALQAIEMHEAKGDSLRRHNPDQLRASPPPRPTPGGAVRPRDFARPMPKRGREGPPVSNT